jgi:hypothetical protein
MIFTVLSVLSFLPDTHSGLLARLCAAILLILDSGIALNQFATILAGKG